MKLAALICALIPVAAAAQPAAEFASRWAKTGKMAVGVAEAMPPKEYAFKPDPPSMTFGEQMAHIAQANYAFCAGLKDLPTPAAPAAADKAALVKFVSDSFDYCTATLTS